MSSPAVVTNIVAAISAGTLGLSKPEGQTAGKPTRPFAQTPALISARQPAKSDKVAASVPKETPPTEDKAVAVARASSKPAVPAKPKSQDGKAQDAEAALQAAGWETVTSPPAARLSKGQLESTTSRGPTAAKGLVQGDRSATSQTGQSIGTTARQASQGSFVNGNREPVSVSGGAEGAMPKEKAVSADKAMPLTQQGVTTGGKATKAASGEVGKSGPGNPLPDKSLAAVKEHADGVHGDVKTNAESGVQALAESSAGNEPGTERRLKSIGGRTEGAASKLSTQASHNVQRGSREAHSPARSSQAASGENTQARQTLSGAVVSGGGQDANSSQPTDSLTMLSGPALSGAGKAPAISQPGLDQPSMTASLTGQADKGAAQSVSEQILDSVRASLDRGEQQVVVRLHPPELGSVVMRFGEQNDQIQGVLEVTRSETRHEVEQALPDVLRSLQDHGIQVRRLDVTVSDQSPGDSNGQPLQQDAWPQQQGSNRFARPPVVESQHPDFESRPATASASISAPAGRIDMLA